MASAVVLIALCVDFQRFAIVDEVAENLVEDVAEVLVQDVNLLIITVADNVVIMSHDVEVSPSSHLVVNGFQIASIGFLPAFAFEETSKERIGVFDIMY